VDPFAVDVSSQAEVRRLAREVLAAYPRLDVLVNNAGGFWATRRVTADGLERTFAVNHLAPFLLSRLLLDRLKASAPARIVTVSSGAHTTGKIDFGDLQGERRYSGQQAYSQSKLANVSLARLRASGEKHAAVRLPGRRPRPHPGGRPAAVRSPLRALPRRRPGRPAQPRSWRVTW